MGMIARIIFALFSIKWMETAFMRIRHPKTANYLRLLMRLKTKENQYILYRKKWKKKLTQSGEDKMTGIYKIKTGHLKHYDIGDVIYPCYPNGNWYIGEWVYDGITYIPIQLIFAMPEWFIDIDEFPDMRWLLTPADDFILEEKLTKDGSLAIRTGANKILNAFKNAERRG